MNMIETAYEIVKKAKEPLTFTQLWKEVSNKLKLSPDEMEDKVSRFYTQISFDNRFIMLEENHWDLKERHSFEEAYIDMNEIYVNEVDDEDLIEAGVAEKEDEDDEEEAPKSKKSESSEDDEEFGEDFEEEAPEDKFDYEEESSEEEEF